MKICPTIANCMNLDHRSDRWNQVKTDFSKLSELLDIKLERISSVYVPECPQQGVTETLKNIISVVKEKDIPYTLIIEDDLYILDANKVKKCLDSVPEDWDILLGGVYHYIPQQKVNDNWMKMKDFCSLHFIIIRNSIYDKILNFKDYRTHIDRFLGRETTAGRITTYLMHPMPCQQHPGYSDIRKKNVNDNQRVLPWIKEFN